MASSSSSFDSSSSVNFEAMETSSEALEEDSLFDHMLNMLNKDSYAKAHLFTFLAVNDIKNCRLVSSAWNEATLEAIPMIDHVVRVPTDRKDELLVLINLISSSKPQFPWTNFEVNAYEAEEYESKNLLPKFFKLVAPFATGIWIDLLEEPLYTEVFTYPALKHLRLNYGLRDAEDIHPDFGMAIVENAPNLVMLDLRGLKITDHALDLLGTSNGRKITRLALRSFIDDQQLARFSELRLQLKYLSIQFRSSPESRDTGIIGPVSIKSLLETQHKHLKELELSDTDEDEETNEEYCAYVLLKVEFPRMDKLTKLKISAFNADYHNICLSTLFPTLRILEFGELDTQLYAESEVLESFLKSDMAPVETVEELKFHNHDSFAVEECQLILNAAKQFPNLRKIQIPNKKALLDCVGLFMANVKELWILSSDEEGLDANLTGLSKEACKTIATLPESQLKSWEDEWEPPRYFRKIVKLGLVAEKDGDGDRDELQLTELGCRFGLSKMEQLETVELIGEISENLLTQLRSHGKFRVEVRNNHN